MFSISMVSMSCMEHDIMIHIIMCNISNHNVIDGMHSLIMNRISNISISIISNMFHMIWHNIIIMISISCMCDVSDCSVVICMCLMISNLTIVLCVITSSVMCMKSTTIIVYYD